MYFYVSDENNLGGFGRDSGEREWVKRAESERVRERDKESCICGAYEHTQAWRAHGRGGDDSSAWYARPKGRDRESRAARDGESDWREGTHPLATGLSRAIAALCASTCLVWPIAVCSDTPFKCSLFPRITNGPSTHIHRA